MNFKMMLAFTVFCQTQRVLASIEALPEKREEYTSRERSLRGEIISKKKQNDFTEDLTQLSDCGNGRTLFPTFSTSEKTWNNDGKWGAAGYTFVGDFNGDGRDDIASASGSLIYLKRSVDNGFKDIEVNMKSREYGAAEYTFVGDFDGDGKKDIASCSGTTVYLKKGTVSGFDKKSYSNNGKWGAAGYTFVGDFNGDGKDDIVSASGTNLYVKLFAEDKIEDQTHSVKGISWGDSEYTFIGDFNGDGRSEIASAKGNKLYYTRACQLLYSEDVKNKWGAGSYTWVGDFDGDGRYEVASASSTSIYMKFNNLSVTPACLEGLDLSCEPNSSFSSIDVYPFGQFLIDAPIKYRNCKEQCPNGWFRRSKKKYCEECVQNCSQCKDSTSCDKCKMPYILSSDEKPTCVMNCPESYYISENVRQCTLCPKGYYCPGGVGSNGIKIKCQDYKDYCPLKGMSAPGTVCPKNWFGPQCESQVLCLTDRGTCDRESCWDFSGNGLCTECNKDTAGDICELNICRDSASAQSINGTVSPSSFDFSLFRAEDIAVSQESERDGDFGLLIKFRPISSDIKEHRLLINTLDVGISSGAVVKCHDDKPPQYAVLPLFKINDPVGTEISICLRGIWKDSKLKLTGGTWEELVPNTISRENPQACTSYTVQFQTRVNFSVRDLYNTVNIEGIIVRYTVDGVEFEGITDSLGRITASIIIPTVDKSERAALIIKEVVPSNEMIDGDFALCLEKPNAGQACDESRQQVFPLENPIVVEHLNVAPQEILILDKTALSVSGKIDFQSGNDSCGIKNVTIVVKNANIFQPIDDSDKLLEVKTNDAGYFEFAVPKQTQVVLEISYNNHTFIGVNQDSVDILSEEGLLITTAKEILQIRDITKSKIIVTSAITDCMFDIGKYDFDLRSSSCPTIKITEPSNGRTEFSITVPAHKYKFDMTGFDGAADVDGGTILKRFKYMFPSSDDADLDRRTLDVTNGDASVTFIYHPNPIVDLEIGEGIFAPETYPSECVGDRDAAFDFAVEGNNLVALMFSFRQMYHNDICDKLPDFSQLLVQSNLGQPLDPCAATTGGCKLHPRMEDYQGFNMTTC